MTIHKLAHLAVTTILVLGVRRLAAQRATLPDVAPYLMDRGAEIRLARSAAPAAIADSARILVLDRGGYMEAVPGTNGFTCVVKRSMAGPLGSDQLWKPRIRSPQCLNASATRTARR